MEILREVNHDRINMRQIGWTCPQCKESIAPHNNTCPKCSFKKVKESAQPQDKQILLEG